MHVHRHAKDLRTMLNLLVNLWYLDHVTCKGDSLSNIVQNRLEVETKGL